MKTKSTGFTLIELLVVIAIIGILSSVVLASLNKARTKGTDGTVRSNLFNARAQAELFYSYNGDQYVQTVAGTSDVCSPTALAGTTKGIYQFALAAANAIGGTVNTDISAQGGPTKVTCHSTPATGSSYAPLTAWAIEAPLQGTYAGITKPAFCVQSDGVATITDITSGSKLANGDARCDQ